MNKHSLQSIEVKQANVLQFIQRARLATTDQIARGWFTNTGSPLKRASEYLHELCEQKLLDVEPRHMQPSLYRLSKTGRALFGDPSPIAPSFKRIAHRLFVGEILLAMMDTETPEEWLPEYRQTFGEHTFAPDIITHWRGKWLVIEAQRTPIPADRWARKWAVYRAYWQSDAWRYAPWHSEAWYVRPPVVVVSNQMGETVRTGSMGLDLYGVRNITELCNVWESIAVKGRRRA